MKDSVLYYSVGPLLYCPANHLGIAHSLYTERFGKQFSLAMCLEDTIADTHVKEAETQLVSTLQALYRLTDREFFLPKIFIRVRAPYQISELMKRLEDAQGLITGFNIPKFSPENADAYIEEIQKVNKCYKRDIYMMPILESPLLIDLRSRISILYELKDTLAPIERLVLNIRVGGNDLCHNFGFRRRPQESIHKIAAISQIFSDIVTVFGMDYVLSGPVWEYYHGEGWETGLWNELMEDRLCGFTGKTVIHPRQIAIVNKAYLVSKKDLEDANAILHWDTDTPLLVSGCTSSERMNEYKVHSNWAKRIQMLAKVYGVES